MRREKGTKLERICRARSFFVVRGDNVRVGDLSQELVMNIVEFDSSELI